MGTTRRNTLFSVLASSVLLAACQSGTAPDLGLEFDSDATLSAYETMDSLFASPSLAPFQALAGRTPFSASPAGPAAVLDHAAAAGGGRAFAAGLFDRVHRLGAVGGPATTHIISDLHRGVTFVYDADAGEYTQDPEREGAPETGVRFVLYEVDLFGDPVVEDEIGYADLVDEGDASAEDVALHLTVVAYEATVLDYRTTLDIQAAGGTLGVHGFLQEPDGPRLDFDIEVTSTEVGEGDPLIDIAFELAIDVRDFSITGTLSGVDGQEDGDGELDLVARHGDDSIRVDVETVGGQIDGTVYVNGGVFANVTGDEDDPDITSATGDPLTLGELLVLHRIVDGAEDVFDFLEDLIDPVDELIILALIL